MSEETHYVVVARRRWGRGKTVEEARFNASCLESEVHHIFRFEHEEYEVDLESGQVFSFSTPPEISVCKDGEVILINHQSQEVQTNQ